jgi:hypothetical protein
MYRGGGGPFGIAAITGGTIIGANVPYVLAQSAIPFIGLSSGSVAANGAISAITALPVAYASAYCWFPANILATSIVAGWYYCTFSTTTAGTAFLNTYSSGVPTIPSSPTAVTDGKGAFTGDTGEEFGPTITVPANALGPNGRLRTWMSFGLTSNANTKSLRLRYSGNAGTQLIARNAASTTGARFINVLVNRAVTNSQYSDHTGVSDAGTAYSAAAAFSAVDTTAATTHVISMQRGTATDNAVLENFGIEVMYGA